MLAEENNSISATFLLLLLPYMTYNMYDFLNIKKHKSFPFQMRMASGNATKKNRRRRKKGMIYSKKKNDTSLLVHEFEIFISLPSLFRKENFFICYTFHYISSFALLRVTFFLSCHEIADIKFIFNRHAVFFILLRSQEK